MLNMNKEQMLSLLRTALKIGGTLITGHGYATSSGWEQLSGGIVMIAPVIWDMFAHTDAAAVAVVEANPDVKKIVIAPTASPAMKDVALDPARPKVATI